MSRVRDAAALYLPGVPAFLPLIIVAFVVFFIVGGVLSHRQQKQRREALGQWAASLGLDFHESQDPTYDGRFTFKALRQGRNRYAYNRAEGVFEGRQVWAFDYHYETTSTRTVTDSKGRTSTKTETHHHHFSAVIVAANVPLRQLLIRPEGWGDKLAAFFGKDDLDFESAEFSRRYHVSAADRKWAYDVLHPRAIEALLAAPRCTIELDDDRHVLILRGIGRLPPEGFHESLRTVDTLLDMMPEYLRQAQRDTDAFEDAEAR